MIIGLNEAANILNFVIYNIIFLILIIVHI